MAPVAEQTRSPRTVSASFTIRRERLTGTAPGKWEGSTVVERLPCYPPDTPDHPLGNTRDVSAFLADLINHLRRGQLDPRVANATGYLTSILLRALEQGPLEERLAKIEAALAEKAQQAKGA